MAEKATTQVEQYGGACVTVVTVVAVVTAVKAELTALTVKRNNHGCKTLLQIRLAIGTT